MSRELDTKYDLWSSKRQEFISSQCNIFSSSANVSQKQTGDEKLMKLSVSSFRSYFGVVSLLVITVIVSARSRAGLDTILYTQQMLLDFTVCLVRGLKIEGT